MCMGTYIHIYTHMDTDHKCKAWPCSVRIQMGSGITPCSEAAASLAMHPSL